MIDWDIKETSSNCNLRCNTQVHARVCDENKLEKNDAYWNNFVVKDLKDTNLKDHIGRMGGDACACWFFLASWLTTAHLDLVTF